MSGVRIHHPTLRSCTYLLWEPGYPNAASQGGYRKPKMRPLLIDAEGNTVVAEVVWRRLVEAGETGRITSEFIFLNEVKDPPKLKVAAGQRSADRPTFERQVRDAIRQIAPAVTSVTIAPSTQYRGDVVRVAEFSRRS